MIDQSVVDALRAALAAAGVDAGDMTLGSRAPASQSFTVAETLRTVERWARALNDLPRYPISAHVTHDPDGRMTITITPHGIHTDA